MIRIAGGEYPVIYKAGEEPYISRDGQKIRITAVQKHGASYTEDGCNFPAYLEKWLNIHDNQWRAGCQIIDNYLAGINYVILIAQMQSGKTGTAKWLAHAVAHCTYLSEPIHASKIYFICGMNDNDLRMQAVKEFTGLIPSENILFSKQLQRLNRDKCKGVDCKLLIVDESHYASEAGSQVDLFIKQLGEGERYYLSISATPMAEIITARDKNIGKVFLQPGKGYYGIDAIFRRGLIYQSADITNDRTTFIDLVCDYYHDHEGDPCYNIVRLPNQWYYYDLEQDLQSADLDIHFINHHGSSALAENDFNAYMNKPPDKFTIIWIYNSLRAGKQVNTRYIGFIHDTHVSRPDTVAQSLLGRMMGYGKAGHHVTCYTDITSANLMLKWTKSAYSDQYVPRGSRSVLNGHADRREGWNLHPPICVELSEKDQEYYRGLKMKSKNRYPYKQDIFLDIIASAGPLDKETVEKVIKNYRPGKCGGLMVLTEFNATRTIRDYWNEPFECYIKRMPCSNVDLCAKENNEYFYVYVNLIRGSKDYGKALVVYKERITDQDTESNFTHINSKSRFQSI